MYNSTLKGWEQLLKYYYLEDHNLFTTTFSGVLIIMPEKNTYNILNKRDYFPKHKAR